MVCVVVFGWVVPLPLCRYLVVGAPPVRLVYSLLRTYRIAAGIDVVCLSISLWLMAVAVLFLPPPLAFGLRLCGHYGVSIVATVGRE